MLRSWQRRTYRHLAWIAGLAVVISTLATILGGAEAANTGPRLQRAVSFAELPGSGPISLFPLYNGPQWFFANEQWFSYLSWAPLYVWGKGSQPVFNSKLSLANPPVFTTTAAGHTVATITLKPWRWSDGKPLTTRDVQFWMNLVIANKVDWAPYVPGYFPDNVTHIAYLSSRTFRITFDAHYSTVWLLGNELPQIFPIPQHAWDRESASQPVGNYDLTTAGARAVYRYLEGQDRNLSTYPTSGLWKVVDGAWEISAYNPSTTYATFVPNRNFSGSPKPRISKFIELSFTSDASEFDSLEAGRVDIGYVPLNDIAAIPSIKARGYNVAPWPQYTWGGILFNFARHDAATPILNQLYVRQAMTELMPMKLILNKLEHGYGYYASGPVADPGGNNPLVTAFERHNPYPYNVAKAKKALANHGWHVVPNGITTCTAPGLGPHQCGNGIARGAQLDLRYLTDTETQLDVGINDLMQSNFSLAGIHLSFHILNGATYQGTQADCTNKPTCSWDLSYGIEYWSDGNPDWWPTGGEAFGCGGIGNVENWCSQQSQAVIARTHTDSSPSALFAYENYMAKEVPIIFLPMPVLRIVAYKRNLQGVLPLNSLHTLYPNDYHWSK